MIRTARVRPPADNDVSPFTLVQQLREYADALRRKDHLALELEADFPLSQTRPAALFQRIRSGILRCEYRPYPCTMMGVFAVSSDHDPRLLTISCRQHLLSVVPTKCEIVTSLEENLTKHACRFQELRRLIGNQPATADVHNQEIKELHRRLRPNTHHSNPDCPHRRRRP